MAKIIIKYFKSAIDRAERQKRTIKALGFTKLNQTLEKEATPQVLGMIAKVRHMLAVVEK